MTNPVELLEAKRKVVHDAIIFLQLMNEKFTPSSSSEHATFADVSTSSNKPNLLINLHALLEEVIHLNKKGPLGYKIALRSYQPDDFFLEQTNSEVQTLEFQKLEQTNNASFRMKYLAEESSKLFHSRRVLLRIIIAPLSFVIAGLFILAGNPFIGAICVYLVALPASGLYSYFQSAEGHYNLMHTVVDEVMPEGELNNRLNKLSFFNKPEAVNDSNAVQASMIRDKGTLQA